MTTTAAVEDTKENVKGDKRKIARRKGKHAYSTENRRMVWENVVWPLILKVNRSYFTLKEYHAKRDEFCKLNNIKPPKVAGGFVSLLVKGSLLEKRTSIQFIIGLFHI